MPEEADDAADEPGGMGFGVRSSTASPLPESVSDPCYRRGGLALAQDRATLGLADRASHPTPRPLVQSRSRSVGVPASLASSITSRPCACARLRRYLPPPHPLSRPGRARPPKVALMIRPRRHREEPADKPAATETSLSAPPSSALSLCILLVVTCAPLRDQRVHSSTDPPRRQYTRRSRSP